MIGHLAGTVTAMRAGYAIVSASGVGYKVATTKETLATLAQGDSIALWTHLAVKETALDLYGFRSEEELHFFELLLTVSGIGPKSALAVLDVAAVDTLRSAIVQSNAGYLTKVSGIGKKTAEKIVVELRDKVGLGADGETSVLHGDEETLEALTSLGYKPSEAREILRKVPQTIEGSNERLREALKILGGKRT